MSTLDASGSKTVLTVIARWQPATPRSAKDSAKLQAMPVKEPKTWNCSNFRVHLGGLAGIETRIVKG